MPASGPTLRPLVVGANHRSSSAATREALFVAESAVPGFLDRLRAAGLAQALVMSTCDRVEVQAAHGDPAEAARAIIRALAEASGIEAGALARELYVLTDADAVRHVFRVAAALDSQVVGESNVAGQLKDSHRMAQERGMTGSELESVLQAAYAASKRVRSETSIGEGAVSTAAAAVEIAREVHGDLARCAALLIGGGEMGSLIAERLRASGLGRLTVTARSAGRAEMLARQWSCHHAPFAGLDAALAEADIVIAAQAAGGTLVRADAVRAALAKRRHKPVYLIDAAVPADIEIAAGQLDGAFLYHVDDLEDLALRGLAGRDRAAEEARDIVEREVEAFLGDRAGRAAAPLVAALRAHFAAVRDAALAEAKGDAERATRLMMNRLLHEPSSALRRIAGAGSGAEAEALVRTLFGLGGSPDEGEEK
jgi:glutamyl-tRNA reductase